MSSLRFVISGLTIFVIEMPLDGRVGTGTEPSSIQKNAVSCQNMEEKEPLQPAQQETGDGPLRTFIGLFLVPLLVVLICVAVFVGFGWIAYDHNSAEDYLNDLKSGWRPRRAQAAYELSKVLVADPGALDDVPGAKEEIRRLFSESDDPEMRRYLALIMGYTQDPAALPLLEETLADLAQGAYER